HCRLTRGKNPASAHANKVRIARRYPPPALVSGRCRKKGQHMKILRRRWWLAAAVAGSVVASAVGAALASVAGAATAMPGGLGQLSGLLPRDHLTLES